MLEELEDSERTAAGMQSFNNLIEDLFRNICETVSPLVDPASEVDLNATEKKVDLTASARRKLKKKPLPSYMKPTST